jgi:hypothetical protein
MLDYETDSDVDNGEIDIEEIQRNIISTMHHLIFCDLTSDRSDCGLTPYDHDEVNEFIADNYREIEMAAESMFAAYEAEDDLASLKAPCLDWFREFLYEFVKTRTLTQDIDSDSENDNDDGEHYGDEDLHSDEEDEDD